MTATVFILLKTLVHRNIIITTQEYGAFLAPHQYQAESYKLILFFTNVICL